MIKLDANLLKKYHKDIFFNYSEYPTKDNWDYDFKSDQYKKSLLDWLPKNPSEPIMLYVHTPFCEQLCYFCFCSKEITSNYSKAEDYLYNYLFKEIDILFDHLKKNNIKLNVKEIYFGGGSPTFYKQKEFKALIDKLKTSFDFDKIGDFTVEIDPRRVDESKLLFYSDCGVNRLSFGVQDFDLEVQKRINRIQDAKLFDSLLTNKVRDKFKVINFDLLIGLPGQTPKSINKTLDKVIAIKPTQLQPMLVHYDPFKRKYMIKMLKDGPLPDFYDRQEMYEIVKNRLINDGGYKKAGFESYALPDDPLIKAMENEKALYNSLGTQTGDVTNFIALGSSGNGCLGDDYYFQNYYEQNKYRECIKNGDLPTFRGMKLNPDDKIRRDILQFLKTYYYLDMKNVEKKFNLNFKEYFEKEIQLLKKFEDDGLLINKDSKFQITEIGVHFTPQIINVFDKYNRIESYEDQKNIIEKQVPRIST
tara:strand:+ start:452 stop:1876 length:1425 start_codon:yes stop_codon:yes gene_type:complete